MVREGGRVQRHQRPSPYHIWQLLGFQLQLQIAFVCVSALKFPFPSIHCSLITAYEDQTITPTYIITAVIGLVVEVFTRL